ncbi:MAG: precorrin-3B C(17)-methyltransferase [Pseudomonadota bacterium]
MALDPLDKTIVVVLNAAGMEVARKLAMSLSAPLHGRAGRTRDVDVEFPNALDHIRDLFLAGHAVIGVCASGIMIRAVAPHLNDKLSEPPVLSVSDDGGVVVPLLGGHRGANRLAKRCAAALGGQAAVTTAGDVALGIALDEPPQGWRLVNPKHAKPAMAEMLSGGAVQVVGPDRQSADWLDVLPEGTDLKITCGVAPAIDLGPLHLQFAPRRATLGLGCARGCDQAELWELVSRMMDEAGICAAAVHAVGTIDLKADEPAILAVAKRLGVPLRLFEASELEALTPRVSQPSDVVFAEVGTHSVAEAAALAQSSSSELLAPKEKTANATCAIGLAPAPLIDLKGRARGRVSIVSTGPGQASWRTPEASRLVLEADELVGYGLYIDLLGPLAAGKKRVDFPLGGEEARCRHALERAGEGANVALICSGDAGIYAMGALVFELLDRPTDQDGVSDAARRVEVLCNPGVSALQGAAARAGAPLGHDFCAISLSDLLTPREDILRRLKAAAEGDFVIAFYNPVSKRRRTLLAEARDILLEHRPDDTPVMLATSLGRPDEHIRYRRLADLEVDEVDMLTVVLVGSSHSRLAMRGEGPRMFTPRGYARRIDGDLKDAPKFDYWGQDEGPKT